jgi:hypothetical protein
MDSFDLRRRRLLQAAIAGVGSTLLPSAAAAKGKWEFVDRERGITVTRRWEKDRQYPTFRATCRIKCNPWDVVAVVQDAARHTEWVHDCSESRLLKLLDTTTGIMYNRTKVAWPAKDRDLIIRGTVDELSPDVELKVRFKAIQSKLVAKPSGVIRIPVLHGHWYLVQMSENDTLTEYQVNADPGGELPTWIVERSSRDMPMITVTNMRRQVEKTKGPGIYDEWIAKARAFKARQRAEGA